MYELYWNNRYELFTIFLLTFVGDPAADWEPEGRSQLFEHPPDPLQRGVRERPPGRHAVWLHHLTRHQDAQSSQLPSRVCTSN